MRKVIFGVFCLCVALLVGCHQGDSLSQEEPVTGEMYDTGQFQILVPEPWKAIPIQDPFAEGRPVMTDCVFLRKGGESDWKVTEKPYIRIDCYGAGEIDTQIPEEDLKHDPEMIDPMELGDLVWRGYTADSYQGRACIGRFATLWAEDGVYTYQVFVWFESGGERISLEDRDLQAILAGVSASKE